MQTRGLGPYAAGRGGGRGAEGQYRQQPYLNDSGARWSRGHPPEQQSAPHPPAHGPGPGGYADRFPGGRGHENSSGRPPEKIQVMVFPRLGPKPSSRSYTATDTVSLRIRGLPSSSSSSSTNTSKTARLLPRLPRQLSLLRLPAQLQRTALPCSSSSHVACKYCLLYTSPSPRDKRQSRMPSSA